MLEVKIEALTIAIDRLTAQLQGEPAIDLETPKPKAKEPKAHLRMKKSLSIEPKAQELESKEVTRDMLRDLFVAKSREDASKKAKIKELLKLFGASKVNDVNDSDLVEIYAEGEQL